MRRLRSLAALIVALPALTGCGGSSSNAQSNPAGAPGPAGRGGGGAIPVKAGPVMVQPVTYRIQAVGTLEAERAEANYRRAVADGENAAATLARREALAREDLVSIEDLNQTRTANERLAADVASFKAARDIAAQNLSRSAVKPRRGGVIDKRLVDTGTFVQIGASLATLVDLTRLQLRFKISETESLRAAKGQTATFKVGATGDREFSARIYHVGEVADPASRQVEVLAWVQNPGFLKPGFFAEVSLPSDSKKDATVVPETAIQASDRGFIAFVIQDGKVVVRPVELGPRTGGGNVEILSGLSAGETIVYEGSDRIAAGVSVTTEGEAPGASESGARPAGRPSGSPGTRNPAGAGGKEPGGRP